MSKERAGRTPWHRPLVGPGTVTRVENRRIELRTDDGLIIRDGDIDDMVVIPPDVDDYEKEPLGPESVEDQSGPRSLGKMIQDGARREAVPARPVKIAIRNLGIGRMVVYDSGLGLKRCACGKAILLSGVEGTVTVHCYRPVSNQHLRVR